MSAHSARYGRPSPALPPVTSCHRLISQSLVCVSTKARPSLRKWGLCTSTDSHSTGCICKSHSLPCSGKRAPSIPLGHSTILPFRPCSSQNSRAASYWLSGLGWPGQEEAGLGWPLSSSEARLQWDLLHLPPWIAVPPDTPQASSSPPTPPTSFPPPDAEVTGSLGWGGVVITWQWGRRQGPGGCCLRDWVIWELESARTGSLARPEPVEAAALLAWGVWVVVYSGGKSS